MKPRIRADILLLAALLVVAAVVYAQVHGVINADPYASCVKTLDQSHEDLLGLMQVYRGQRLSHDTQGFGAFSALFDARVSAVDLRNPDSGVSISFATLSDVTKSLIYCTDDRCGMPWTSANTALEQDADELRLEGLGINGKGYIECRRIMPCWFYYEAYLPT